MISKAALEKIFPDESPKYLASGVKSAVFRTAAGKIIRVKPVFYGTYAKERRILDMIHKNGGIECAVPRLATFSRFPWSFSVHDEIRGINAKKVDWSKVPPARKKALAEQLAKALVKLRGIKTKMGVFARWIQIWHLLQNYFRARIYVGKKMHEKYMKMCRAERSAANLGLIHNDLHFDNVIVDDKFNLAGIIDFDNARMGHFEHNLRKMPPEFCDAIAKILSRTRNEINPDILDYYRLVLLLKKIRKSPNRRAKSSAIRDLREFFSSI